ncbi:MAG TPA: hypothetical protein VNO30_42790 [Kofleriaceae bacterium]|nr:hypothetical protein [Kofleriaceae bacterium]
MKTEKAFVGARGVDSLPYSIGGTAEQARKLAERGVDFFAGYLGSMNVARLKFILDAGLAFMPITRAEEYFDGGADEVDRLRALELPKGCTVWLDLEGEKSYRFDPIELQGLINTWAKTISAAEYIPGLYVGAPQPLTGPELARLAVVRYWKAPSLVLDRNGKDWSEPSGIGWCMYQMWPSLCFRDTDICVDVNIIGEDRRGRVPSWVVL